MEPTSESHDRGLAFDLSTLLERRRLLQLFGGLALAPLALNRLTGTATAATSAAGLTDALCLATVNEETAGPYPGDGSNGKNVLTQSGIVRSDIRSSIGSASGVAQGVLTTIKLTILNNADSCNPLVGAAVYLWHCDRDGNYSMYSSAIANENYLRGVQVTDANGTVTFTSIFPACYSGRWPHIHYEVYPNTAAATSSANKIATSQIALPQAACSAVYSTASGYSASVTNLSQVSLATDNVFRDGVSLELATVTGSVSEGMTVSLTVAVSTTASSTPTTDTSVTPTTSPNLVYATSAFTPLAAPARFLDTRNGIGASGRVTPGTPLTVSLLGTNGLPTTNVSAVMFNLTATDTAGWGYVAAWPEGTAPGTSNLNVDAAGQTRANLVTVPVSSDGAIRVMSSVGTHLLGDLVGYFSPASTARAGRFVAVTPSRLLDTRAAVGVSGTSRVAAGSTTLVAVAAAGGIPATGVSAVVLNVTATDSQAWGYVTAWSSGDRPSTSNLNVDAAGQTVANQVVIPVGADGAVRIFSSASTHLIADVVGYFTDATADISATGLFTPVSPYRVLDTRSGNRQSSGSTLTLLLGAPGTAAAGRGGAVLNTTLTATAGGGFLTVWPSGARPNTSSVNSFVASQTVAGHVITALGSDGGVRLYNDGSTHLVADVTGWFSA